MADEYSFELTMALGKRSMGYLKEYRTPAIPRHYELFYTYASGYNKELNEAVRAIVLERARVTTAEAGKLYDAFLSPIRHCDQIGDVARSLIDAIDDILEATHCATNSTTAYGAALETLRDQLHQISDTAQLKSVLQSVIAAAKRMAQDYKHIEQRFSDSQERVEELQHHMELARAELYTDPLTGIANRKRFERELKKAFQAAREENKPLSLLMVDIDHFKKFNDTFGHQAGDSALRLVARAMKANVKGRDLAARYGGEEFAVLLPMTTLEDAITIADQIRQAVMEKELIAKGTGRSLGRINLSVGVASCRQGDTITSLVGRADTCLYAAKRQGRNRSVSERELDFEHQSVEGSVGNLLLGRSEIARGSLLIMAS